MTLISGISSLLAIGLLSPVQSIVAMIALFVSTALALYNSGYVLMGILYVLVYVGAIAILFLFILSLLDIEYTHTPGMHPLIVSILVICLLPLDLGNSDLCIGILETPYSVYNELHTIGILFYTEYAIPMVIIAVVLVLSIIGAIAIAK
uniref:NADH-ubiquinone oxidoreductase chain 6 n=1 Tax=Candida chauliodis TaxID=391825 RepID=S5U6C8_9ASCO|nr:NADH dehydrogenase subunit 6 [Candida chauliodis]AGS44626.1 NADH dehydrogenase subunit 6 [Candida chauliodis]